MDWWAFYGKVEDRKTVQTERYQKSKFYQRWHNSEWIICCKKWPDEIWGNIMYFLVSHLYLYFALDNLPEWWHLPGHRLSECCQVSSSFPEELCESQLRLQRPPEQRFWEGSNLDLNWEQYCQAHFKSSAGSWSWAWQY